MNAVALGVLYAVMPNRRANWRAVAPSALFAGAAWFLIQALYVKLQVGVAHYNAIYGAMAQLPVTLAWLYVSWAIVLAGAELAAIVELGSEAVAAGERPVDRCAVALELLVRAQRAFAHGGAGPNAVAVARALHLDVALVQEVAADLIARGWLAAEDAQPRRLLLARAATAIDLGELAELRMPGWVPSRCDPAVHHAITAATARARAGLGALSLDAVTRGANAADTAPAGPPAAAAPQR